MNTAIDMKNRYAELHQELATVISEVGEIGIIIATASKLVSDAKVQYAIEPTIPNKSRITKKENALGRLRSKENDLFENRQTIEAAITLIKGDLQQKTMREKSEKIVRLRPLVEANYPDALEDLRHALARAITWQGLRDGTPARMIDPKSIIGQALRDRTDGLGREIEQFKDQLRSEHNLQGVIN